MKARTIRPEQHSNWSYSTVRNYLTSKHTPNTISRRKLYQEIFPSETYYFAEAKRLEPRVYRDFRSRTVRSPASFVAVVDEGRICGNDDYVLTRQHQLLQDVSFGFHGRHLRPISRQRALQRWNPRSFRYFPRTAASLGFCSSHNYFHWLFDVLPRIELLRLSGIQADRLVLNRRKKMTFHTETLRMLGIPGRQILDRRINLQARKVVVPSLINRYSLQTRRRVKPRVIPKWSCEFLRSSFLPKDPSDGTAVSEYIYISRQNARHRKIVNEKEVLHHLKAFGFRRVLLEKLSFAEQVQLFARAKAVIAPHGAGLANLAFCSPGTKVIELFSEAYKPAYYWMISNHLQLDYYYMINKSEHPVRLASNFRVDPSRLLQLVKLAGISILSETQ